ncbi:Rrf2 family transcriptional regulator [Fulvivirga kasyanovii]|uniref:Rrf2 family transcriptional regulator n=1 Tax=Fulvivirga kasyanovii TaxID=396812 RepID=A0ABW9RJR6_9BACT|nr:Rrf2 family transcriptional regulator [Fulvivirga kasyanovii]MTI24181.1 Rrf2 family transcriptional regulator [Fulvivirga kasyanovii]
MFSKACEYGIKAMIYIAQAGEGGRLVSLKEIAAEIQSPVAFTAKILQLLSREGILLSTKGAFGGFQLAAAADKINLAEIVKAIDGDRVFNGCGLGLKECNALKPCPVHFKFAAFREQLADMLQTTNLHELAAGLKKGVSFLYR